MISYQQRGLKPSSIGGPYPVRRHVSDAIELLDELGVVRAWMIGHSWGGYLAMAIAAWEPEHTLGWIAIDPLGIVGDGGMEELGSWLGRDVSPEERTRAEELDQDGSAPRDEETFPESLAIHWPNYFADPTRAPAFPDISSNDKVYADAIEDALALNERGELVRELVASGRPGVVVAGSESGLRHASEVSAEVAGARLVVVDDAGHFPWLEVPGSIREAVAEAVS